MRVFVTGAAGDIGSRLCPVLAGTGIEYTAMDRVRQDSEGLRGDMLDSAVGAWFEGHDALIHLASVPGDATEEETFRSNVLGAWRVLSAASRSGIRRIVLTSSAPVHLDQSRAGLGDTPLATGTDDDRVYDVSKRLQESLAEDVAQHGVADGLTVLCLRLGHVVDPGAAADFEGRGLAELSYCRGGWVDVADATAALVAALSVDARPRFHLHHVIGDSAARARYKVAEAEAFLGITFQERFDDYRGESE